MNQANYALTDEHRQIRIVRSGPVEARKQPSSPRKCAILQSNYIPWKGYFDLIASVDHFILYDCVQYTKGDWRNRNKIKTAAGVQWLTIPVSVPGLATRIDDVEVSDPKWAQRHWRTLSQNYSRSKHFDFVQEALSEFYSNTEERKLSSINSHLLRTICALLGIETKISQSTDYVLEGDRNLRLLNLCKQVGAEIYVSGPAASCYLDKEMFQRDGIQVEWMQYAGYPTYTQRFGPFEHYVSILDLLFNEGPDAPKYMLKAKPKSELRIV